MRNKPSKLGSIFCWIMLAALLFSTGCAQATAPEVVAAATNPVSDTAVPPTAAPEKVAAEPTATSGEKAAVESPATATTAPETAKAEQATPLPATATEQPTKEAPASSTGLSAWCLPLNTALSYAKDPLNPPAFAKQATFADAMLHVHGLPATGCMFLVTFDKAAPTSLTLEVYEARQSAPFFKVELQPVDGSPETLWAFVQHGSIVAPGRSKSVFALMVKDPLGQDVQKAELKLYSWVPGTPEPKEDDCGCEIDPGEW